MFNEKKERNRYSLRKLSIGLASILLGISFVSVTGNNVKADTVNNGKNGDQTAIKSSNTAIKIDPKASEAVTKLQAAAEKAAKGNAPEAAVKPTAENTLKGANSIAKQQNTAVKDAANPAKQGLDTVAAIHSNSNETALNLKDGNAIAQNMLKDGKANQAGADPAKNKLRMTDLLTTTDKKLNAQMLSASKVISPVKDTNDAYALDSKNGLHEHANVNDNGGYDEDYWGKINVDDWNYTVNGDRIEINSLKDSTSTGANDAIIVPNLDNFKLAGKDGGAKTVYISSSTLRETAQHKYYGLSKTNGNTFATNSELAFVFYNDSNLTHVDLNSLDTSNVTNMSDMFTANENLTNLDLSNWDTSKVTDMSGMFDGASSLTSLDVSHWDTSKVTNMRYMFNKASSLVSLNVSHWKTGNVTNMGNMFDGASSLTSLDVSKWNTSKVTDMIYMFDGTSSLTSLDVSHWDTSKVTDMNDMFADASGLTNLDVSNWKTGHVTNMSFMFYNASGLTNLDVSNWDTGRVHTMYAMFNNNPKLALVANSGKFADYLVNHDSFDKSRIDSSVKSVTTDNAKLLKLLTSDIQHDSSTRTITFTFPANYSPDLTKYHLTKVNNIYQIKQSIDYATSYAQGTVLINETDDITKHHIDTTKPNKPNKLSDTWQPNYDKLVLAHKNTDGTVSFDKVHVPKIPGYKTEIKHNTSKATKVINRKTTPFIVSYIAIPTEPAIVPDKPAVTPGKPTVKLNKPDVMPSRSDVQNYTSDRDTQTPIAVAGNVDMSQNVNPIDFGWKITAKIGFDNNKRQTATYKVTSRNYSLNLPYVENRKLHLVKQYTTKDAVSFAYIGQNTKYVFNIKFVNGHYLLTTYKIKSDKLIKLIDYSFIKSSKMIDVILNWLQIK